MGKLIVFLVFFPIWIVLAEMWEYSFNVWFGKDLPWWLDYVCAFAFNGVVFPIWVVSLILDFTSVTPIFP